MQASRPSSALLALGAALALASLSVIAVLSPPSADLHPSNPYWNGLESFFRAVNAKTLEASLQGAVPENSIVFIIGPSVNLSEAYIEDLKAYVLNGGALALLDETGAVNAVLSAFGLGIRVDGHAMLDAVFYHRSWRMPKIIDVRGGELTRDVNCIVLNIPSVLKVDDPRAKVLARSSSFSFLDLNGDSKPQGDEPVGPFVVAAEAAYGKGRVIVFSDSSIFINSVLELGDNRRLLENIVGERSVFVDVGVWPKPMQLAYRSAVLSLYSVTCTPEFKYSLALLTAAVIYALTHRGKRPVEVEEVEELLKRHPDWDRRLLEALREARSRVEE